MTKIEMHNGIKIIMLHVNMNKEWIDAGVINGFIKHVHYLHLRIKKRLQF